MRTGRIDYHLAKTERAWVNPVGRFCCKGEQRNGGSAGKGEVRSREK